MRVLVIGGDGYCGWATALHLSNRGHDVGILDSSICRHWDSKLGVQTLTPIAPIQQQLQRWQVLIGKAIALLMGDTNPYEFLQQRKNTLPHPKQPNSFYPLSKVYNSHKLAAQFPTQYRHAIPASGDPQHSLPPVVWRPKLGAKQT